MTGLLHRLAQRTLNGNPPRVRSAAPIPWLATPGAFEAAEPAPPAVPNSVVPPARTPVPGSPNAPRPDPPEVSPAAGAAPEREEAPAEPARAFGVEPPAPLGGVTDVALAQPNPQSMTGLPEDVPSVTASPAVPSSAAAPAKHPLRATRVPAPLLPPPPGAAAAPDGTRGGPHATVAGAGSEPATEVYVHIGRVELTAVAESPAPQRKARPARTGPSLDEFLQRRKERYR